MTYHDPLGVAIVAIAVAAALVDRWRSDEEDPVDALEQAYEEGDITLDELERRLELHVDDRNQQIREVVEQVNGVGEATSRQLAHEFESLQQLQRADRDRLEAVHGVGSSTAAALVEYLRK